MDQAVTSTYAYNGSMSFKMVGDSGRWAMVDFYFENGAEVVLRAVLMSEDITQSNTSQGLHNINAALGFSMKGTSELFGAVLMADDGNVIMRDGTETFILMPYQPLQWYDCQLMLNSTTGSISTYIDGELLVSSSLNVDARQIDTICLASGESGVPGYFDDLCLTVEPWPDVRAATGGLYPIPLVPLAAVLFLVVGFFMFRQVRASYSRPKQDLRAEDVMKAFGMGAPMLSMGLIISLNNGAFGDGNRDAMLFGGIVIMSLTLLLIAYLLNKMRMGG